MKRSRGALEAGFRLRQEQVLRGVEDVRDSQVAQQV